MAEGSSEGTRRDKVISLDGITFNLAVIRNERGTQAMVEAVECRPQHPKNRKRSYLVLHSQPYDPTL
jgi:hypothetical protein